jgi:hypothetical protein
MKVIAPGGASQANQAAIEAATDENTYIPPDLLIHSRGVAKVWCNITAAGVLSSPDHGVSTVGDTGTGDRDINFTTAFSDADMAIAGEILQNDNERECQYHTLTTADVQHVIHNDAGVAVDLITGTVIFGDQ